ncbi:protein IMPACT-like [Ostrinia furnacalis]|uniref:protein IMPACT-like n=1 Tax=Ostrinia furnacalis TaxID=93504 RepID=UPI00103D8B42|nr:protein IMPACT-like [Ostrinia furnacalis]
MSFNGNITLQDEEVQALSSIYGDDWSVESEVARTYRVRIRELAHVVLLVVTMSPGYPGQAPPEYELSAPWMDRAAKNKLHQSMDAVYLEHIGQPTIYNWVEKIRSFLRAMKPAKKQGAKQVSSSSLPAARPCPPITHGEVVTDRKSSFQGHAAQVTCVEEVHAVLASLKANRKIANAKHNMFAYRITCSSGQGSGTVLQECSDDGEAHAGGRMLHLMEVMDQRNTLVVVTRWYGGIHLGPDRFRHITNATRQAIEVAGLLRCSNKTNNSNSGKSKK